MSGKHGEERKPQDDLYRSIIMSHYRSSPYRHGMENPSFRSGEVNRTCGDKVELFLRIEDGVIADASFLGEGCSLCMASASILCQELKGLRKGEVLALHAAFSSFLASDAPEYSDSRGTSDALSSLGSVRAYGARIPCVLLGWNILTLLGAE